MDVLKHAFMAKFNDIRPDTYKDVLRDLARRTLRVHSHQAHLVLGFVPIAPLALAIRAAPPILTVVFGCGAVCPSDSTAFDRVAAGFATERASRCDDQRARETARLTDAGPARFRRMKRTALQIGFMYVLLWVVKIPTGCVFPSAGHPAGH